MKKLFLLTTSFITLVLSMHAQSPIDISETTVKINALSEEIFYYGFSEGDQLIFNFEEENGKELKELEITELPSSSRFMDYKTKKIENKTLQIPQTGIYKFRLSNSAIVGRICKVKIQRIPATEASKKFNTAVFWKTTYDTTYTAEQENYLIKSDTGVVNITDQVAKVHSSTNLDGNKTSFNFTLPKNTVVWSYYIGVDQGGQQAFANAMNKLSESAGPLIAEIPGYGPLAALALGSTSFLSVKQSGEDVDFYILNDANMGLYKSGQSFNYLKKGKVINDFSRMAAPISGELFVCLSNDNLITGISVAVKITAIVVNQEWGVRPIQKMHIKSQQVAYLKN